MAFAFGRATPSLRQAPSRCLDNPVLGNIIFSLDGEHHLLLKVLHFRVDKRRELKEMKILIELTSTKALSVGFSQAEVALKLMVWILQVISPGPVEMQREWLDDLNVFCVYAAHSGDLDLGNLSTENIDAFRNQLEIPDDCLNLGKFAVVVKDVAGFISRVETSVKSENYRVFRGFVKYYNPETFHGSFSDEEAIFRKRDEHKHQQEYRFVIDTLVKGTNPITLNIGDINDITIRFNAADMNKDFLGGKIELKLS